MKNIIEILKNVFNRYFWFIIFFLFLTSRVIGLFYFEPHNDEVIYTQYAQLIHSDWNNFWDISIGGKMFGDYKDPLQFWLTSLTVGIWHNPLFGVRIWSVLFSLLGLYFFTRFAKRAIGEKEARVIAILWIFSSYYFYFDSIGITEVYIYSIVSFLIYVSYRIYEIDKWRYFDLIWILLLIFAFAVGLFLKQSIIISLPLLAVIPLIGRKTKIKFKKYILFVFLLAGCYWLASQAYSASPVGYYSFVKQQGLALVNNTFSFTEILSLPCDSWLNNLKFYFNSIILVDIVTIVGLIIISISFFLSFFRKNQGLCLRRYGIILVWLLSFFPSIILLKSNNVRHYGMFSFIFLAAAAIAFFDIFNSFKKARLKIFFASSLILIIILNSGIILTDLLQYRATKLSNIEIGDIWASPLKVDYLIDKISSLPAGLLFFDSQWGNPGTAIQIFSADYPQLKLAPLVTDATNLKSIILSMQKYKIKTYLVFDKGTETSRPWAKKIIDDEFLCKNREVITKSFRQNIYKNTAIVICYPQM